MLDAVGVAIFKRSIGVLNLLGTIVAIGFADGWWDPLDTADGRPQPPRSRASTWAGWMKPIPKSCGMRPAELIALWEQAL